MWSSLLNLNGVSGVGGVLRVVEEVEEGGFGETIAETLPRSSAADHVTSPKTDFGCDFLAMPYSSFGGVAESCVVRRWRERRGEIGVFHVCEGNTSRRSTNITVPLLVVMTKAQISLTTGTSTFVTRKRTK